jgi:hypothetical protein
LSGGRVDGISSQCWCAARSARNLFSRHGVGALTPY